MPEMEKTILSTDILDPNLEPKNLKHLQKSTPNQHMFFLEDELYYFGAHELYRIESKKLALKLAFLNLKRKKLQHLRKTEQICSLLRRWRFLVLPNAVYRWNILPPKEFKKLFSSLHHQRPVRDQ